MELNWFQKFMLLILAGMLVFFGVLMAVLRAHPGVLFEESLLKITEYEGQMVYSGRAYGTPVSISVTYPTNFKTVVDFTIGTEIHDVCEVLYPTQPIETEHGYTVDGICVTKNGEQLFTGGYDPESEIRWYDANGEWTPFIGVDIRGHVSGDPWRYYETTTSQIVRFAFGPETSACGDPAMFGLAVFLSAITALNILFWKQFFRWRHWAARDPEPSEAYEYLERIGWVVLTAIAAIVYIIAMTKIY